MDCCIFGMGEVDQINTILFAVDCSLLSVQNGVKFEKNKNLSVKIGYSRSLFAVVNNNLVIFTTWYESVPGRRKVYVIDPVCIFFENLCYSETSNDWLRQLHFAFNVHSVSRKVTKTKYSYVKMGENTRGMNSRMDHYFGGVELQVVYSCASAHLLLIKLLTFSHFLKFMTCSKIKLVNLQIFRSLYCNDWKFLSNYYETRGKKMATGLVFHCSVYVAVSFSFSSSVNCKGRRQPVTPVSFRQPRSKNFFFFAALFTRLPAFF